MTPSGIFQELIDSVSKRPARCPHPSPREKGDFLLEHLKTILREINRGEYQSKSAIRSSWSYLMDQKHKPDVLPILQKYRKELGEFLRTVK